MIKFTLKLILAILYTVGLTALYLVMVIIDNSVTFKDDFITELVSDFVKFWNIDQEILQDRLNGIYRS